MKKRALTVGLIAATLLLPATFAHLNAAAPITSGLAVSIDATSSTITGTTWGPSDGTAYSATLTSSSMYTSPNTFVTFGDSSNNAADFGNIMSTAGDISADMWFYITTMHTTNWNILATKWFGGTGADWHFGFYQGKLRNYFYNTNYIEDSVNPQGGAGWYHAAFTIKQPSEGTCPGTSTSGTSSIYLNGARVATVTATYACHLTSSSMNFTIGDVRTSGLLGIDGKVAKFRFYTRALSLAEINKLYRADAAIYGLSAAPYNTAIPAISGTTKVGQSLSGTNGTWVNGVTGYTYQWYRSATSNGTYAPISAATSSNYTTTSSDLNQYLKLEVTAANAQGSIPETSTSLLINQGTPNLTLTVPTTVASSKTQRSISLSPGATGKVTFTNNGKRIARCINLSSNSSNSYSVSCPWSPAVIGFNNVQAIFTSTDSAYASGASTITQIFVQKRTGQR